MHRVQAEGVEMIRALTIWQPWASLIAVGAKKIETRGWTTGYRGPLAIHAAKRWRPAEQDFTEDEDYAPIFDAYRLDGSKLPLGCVVAIVNLFAVVPSEKAIVQLEDKEMWDEIVLGNYAEGRYGFCLTDVQALPEPVPAVGKQGFWWWDMPSEYKAMIERVK